MNLFSLKDIDELLSRYGFRFSKSLGQNFLTDSSVCERIAEFSDISPEDGVLEIGPGIGSLTRELAEYAKKVVSVEIDRALIPVLSETLAKYNNIKIINDDIMKCDIPALTKSEFCGIKPKVCANLPYYITTPIITKLIESNCFSSITTMIQKEVAQRICAKPKTSAYGAFTVFVQYYAETELLFHVPKSSFIPQPKVDSAVIIMKMREKPLVRPKSENLFFKVVKASFAQRRKQLTNCLFAAFESDFTKEETAAVIKECGHKATVRGEELSIEDFCRLSDLIYERLN